MLRASNLIFYGCENPMCVMDGCYGCGCYNEACKFICSDTGCYEGTRVNPESRKTRRNMRRKLVEKYAKLQEEIESREKSEFEKSKDESQLPNRHNVAIATTGIKNFIDEVQTTVQMPKEDSKTRSPSSLAKMLEISVSKAVNSREAPESNPLEEKKPPKQTTKKGWTPNQVGLLLVFRAGHRIRWVFLSLGLDTESGGSSVSLGLDTESGGSSRRPSSCFPVSLAFRRCRRAGHRISLNSATASILGQSAMSESATVHCFSFVSTVHCFSFVRALTVLGASLLSIEFIADCESESITIEFMLTVSPKVSPLEFLADCESKSITELSLC
ncbi:unnamed protein product [Rodentolepis nana]|uniref:ARF7EP_C domain-containing protein n=1 Tax=Rodentolepis nana TaxID=102285 RepID=A0A0R3TEN7_RODNA|nr:unnamed protein product [Rodentolepis nana]